MANKLLTVAEFLTEASDLAHKHSADLPEHLKKQFYQEVAKWLGLAIKRKV